MPGLATLINFCITDTLYYKGSVRLWYPVMALWLASNYHGVKQNGIKVAYPFLTWQDPTESGCVILGFTVMVAGLVLTLAIISEGIKGRALPTIEEARGHQFSKQRVALQRGKREKIE